MIWFFTPYRNDKDLGLAYNQYMSLISRGDTAVLQDYDTMLLTPNTPLLIQQYAEKYPDAVLTCYTNRISVLSDQLYGGVMQEDADIRHHIAIAQSMQGAPLSVKRITRPISGFLMVVPRHVWERVPFPETGQCLGVDTLWSRSLHKAGVEVLLMETVYVWHTYRLLQGVKDKTHLK